MGIVGRKIADVRQWDKNVGIVARGDAQMEDADEYRTRSVSLRVRYSPPVFNPRSRVSTLSIVARGRGNTRILLTVTDNRRSATA